MADLKKQLKDFKTIENSINGNEYVFVSQNGNTRKTTINDIKKFTIGTENINNNIATIKSDIGTENMGTSATTIKGAIKEHEEGINNITTQLDTIVQQKAEKYEVDNIQKQVDNLVIEASGDSNAEVIQSRDGENVLNERFKKIENLNRLTNTDLFTTEIEQERIVQSKKLLKHDLTIVDDEWFNIIYYTPIIGTTYYIEVPSKAYSCPIAIEKTGGTIEGIVINSEPFDGFKTVNAKITISSDVSKILICTTNANLNNIILKKYILQSTINKVNLEKHIENHSLVDSYWKGKKIVWFGTSIPAGGYIGLNREKSYPMMIGKKLGANVVNEAVGSSAVSLRDINKISGNNPYGFSTTNYSVCRELISTVEEKQWLIDNYDTFITNWKPDLTEELKNEILSFSYENKLVKKHLGEGNRADLYVFDHGYNDRWRYDDKFLEIPENPYDKNHFIGAMNFLIKLIYEDNPRARIALIGHYENDRSKPVSEAQKIIAEYWDIPLIRTWELMGWSQKVINGKTLTQHWMPDDLHPHSDESGQALQLYTDVLTPYINNLR